MTPAEEIQQVLGPEWELACSVYGDWAQCCRADAHGHKIGGDVYFYTRVGHQWALANWNVTEILARSNSLKDLVNLVTLLK